jgi:hypothetical protein
VADDRVAAAVAELYGVDPDAFTERRKALVAAAREAGDRPAAAAIGALRKPTRAAWVVNRLARADPSAADRMASLAAELRAAEAAKDGARLRELSAARGALIDGLVGQALAAAGTPDPPAGLRAEVTDTLTAALGDPETAARFAAGTLTKAAQWGGFGYAGFGIGDGSAVDGGASPDPAPVDLTARRSRRARTADQAGSDADAATAASASDLSAPSQPNAAPRPIRLPKQASRRNRDPGDASSSAEVRAVRTSAQAAAQRTAKEREEERQAAEEQRRTREAAERAAQAREKFEDVERTVAQASAAATEALSVEDRLESEVRDLEERLTKAREDLAAARRRARHAEAAERRARQALDRLPRP